MTSSKKIAVVGDWHLAFVTAAVLADCGHKVQLINPLKSSGSIEIKPPPIPVHEPGLKEMMDRNYTSKNLSFFSSMPEQFSTDFIWLAVDTPINDRDEPLLEPLLVIADQILKAQPKAQLNCKTLVVSSQVPLGFCQELEKRTGLSVAYVPENLRLGKGIETFFRADRTVIGSNDSATADSVKNLMSSFETEFLLCNLTTAEMVKHANNAFFATSISFSNELARIGEKFGVDSALVGKALKLDKRIGKSAYVIPGLGFAGGTLPRDLRVLQQLGKESGLPTSLIDAVLRINEETTIAISEIVQSYVLKNNLPKSALILGYTYKPDTNTLRRSLSIDVASNLRKAGFEVLGLDPVMNKEDLSLLKGKIDHSNSFDRISGATSVVLLMTARPEFSDFNWQKVAVNSEESEAPSLVLDCQNYLKAESVLTAGLVFKSLWSPTKYPNQGAVNESK